MAYRTMDRPTFGGSLRLGASFPNHVSSLPAPSLSKRKLLQSSVHMDPSTLSPAHPTSSTYWPLAARKLTRRRFILVAPLRRTSTQQLPRRCASGLLATQIHRRSAEAGVSSQLPIRAKFTKSKWKVINEGKRRGMGLI